MAEKNLIPFWINNTDPLAWDTVWLDGVIFPGVATVGGSGLKRKVDVKKPKGSDGATLRDEGLEPARIDVELLIYNEQDWLELQAIWKKISPRKKGGVRKPITILHPLTTLFGIDRIYIDTIPFPDFDKRNQFLKLRFSAIEWFQAPRPVRRAAGTQKKDGTADSSSLVDDTVELFDGLLHSDPVQSSLNGLSGIGSQLGNGIANSFTDLGNGVVDLPEGETLFPSLTDSEPIG